MTSRSWGEVGRHIASAVLVLLAVAGCARSVSEATSTSPRGVDPTVAPDPVGDTHQTALLFDHLYYVWYGNPALDGERFAPGSHVVADDSMLAGSKCSPGAGDSLPDGIWAVRVSGWGDDLTVDLVCWYLASLQLTWDMMLPEHPECDAPYASQAPDQCWGYAQRVTTNDNPELRTQVVDPAAEYVDPQGEAVGLRWAIENDPQFDPSQTFWIYVNSGLVTQVYQPFEAGGE